MIPSKTIAVEKCDLNKCIDLFENRNITTNECMAQNNMEDYYSMKFKDKVNEQLSKFDNVLFSLDAELNPIEASLVKQQVYRRLSEKYVSSPSKFTEKLITIIEESVINNTLNMSNNSMINFKKISKELQRMCDNLENESMPEQLLFTTVTSSPSKEISKIIMDDNSTQTTTEKRCSELSSTLTLNVDSCIIKTPSPSIMPKKVYRKTPRSIFKSEMKRMDDTIPLSASKYNNMSFEHLEAYCERLFPNEKRDRTSVQTIQDSTLLSMDHVFTICEQQLASLNSTSDDMKVISQKKNEDSIKELQTQSKDTLYHLYNKPGSSIRKDKDRYKRLKKIDEETYTVNVDSEYIHCTDELDKTLLSEIVEKRRRCLDTAKKMIEINSECDTMELEEESKVEHESTLDVSSHKPQDDNANFLKMLISCKDYHNYLESQLPMLNVSASPKMLAVDADMNKTNKKNINIDVLPNEKILSTNKKSNSKSRRSKSYTENYRKILARWNIDNRNEEGKPEEAVNKPNLFTTPGKMSAKDKRMQRVFFADICTSRKQRSPLRTSTSCNKQLSNVNCMSRTRSSKRESLKPTVQVANSQLFPNSIKSPQKKGSKGNFTHTPSTKYLIKRNLSILRKYGVDKNKENKVN